jgi:hypothetical protein
MDERQTLRWAAAALSTALTLVVYYSLDLVYTGLGDLPPDLPPDLATTAAPGRSAYLWRVAICGCLTPILLVTYGWLARGRETAFWRLTEKSLIPVVALAALLAVVFA